MRLASSHRGLPPVLGAALTFLVGTARAEDNAEQARALFKEGRARVTAGQYEEACPKFEASRDLDPGVGTDFNLADCWEHIGRLESARALFVKVADVTHALGQTEREKRARVRAAALEARLPRVVVVTVEVPQPAIDAPAPGPAVAFEIVEQPTSSFTVHRTARETVLMRRPEPRNEATPERLPPPEKGKTAKAIAYVLAGTAAVGAVTAGVALGYSASKNSRALNLCQAGSPCTREDIANHDDLLGSARTAQTVGLVGLSVAVTSVVSIATILTTRAYWRAHTETPGWTPGFSAGPGSASVALGRSF